MSATNASGNVVVVSDAYQSQYVIIYNIYAYIPSEMHTFLCFAFLWYIKSSFWNQSATGNSKYNKVLTLLKIFVTYLYVQVVSKNKVLKNAPKKHFLKRMYPWSHFWLVKCPNVFNWGVDKPKIVQVTQLYGMYTRVYAHGLTYWGLVTHIYIYICVCVCVCQWMGSSFVQVMAWWLFAPRH